MRLVEFFEIGSTHRVTLLTDPRKTWGPVSFQLFWRANKNGKPRQVSLTLQGTINKPFVWLNGHKGTFVQEEDTWLLVVSHSRGTERYVVTHVDEVALLDHV